MLNKEIHLVFEQKIKYQNKKNSTKNPKRKENLFNLSLKLHFSYLFGFEFYFYFIFLKPDINYTK